MPPASSPLTAIPVLRSAAGGSSSLFKARGRRQLPLAEQVLLIGRVLVRGFLRSSAYIYTEMYSQLDTAGVVLERHGGDEALWRRGHEHLAQASRLGASTHSRLPYMVEKLPNVVIAGEPTRVSKGAKCTWKHGGMNVNSVPKSALGFIFHRSIAFPYSRKKSTKNYRGRLSRMKGKCLWEMNRQRCTS
ncbi:hypothetical protein DFH09DRAFT_1145253 [Mycena vulgaris]|nr:hypothetical protein DFH09DRAFT_1145253 [Mycena vulgaris]